MKLKPEQITNILLSDKKINKEMMDKIIPDDEQSRKEFDEYLKVWESSANLKDYDKISVQGDWRKVRAKMGIRQNYKRIPMRKYMLRIAAVFLLALGLTYFLSQVLRTTSSDEIQYFEVAAIQDLQTIELPDGSVISLNYGSKIIRNSEYGKSNRDIILEGEAFFDVARNEEIPFKVHSRNSIVEVLGTQFVVNADSSLVSVGVVSGKVALYESQNTRNRIELNKQHAGIYNAESNKIVLQPQLNMNSIIWYTNEFVFRNEPLKNVCEVIADHYNLKLVTDAEIEFIDSINITCSAESIETIITTINSFLVENVELINSDELLIVQKI